MADYLVTDTELTSIANAIRTKGGTSASLEFPSEFVQAINDIQTGGGGATVEELNITQNGTYVAPSGKAYSPVNVDLKTLWYPNINEVTFIDYDGTVLHTYTANEFLTLSAMPSNPSHNGLIAQGWNYTFAEAQAFVSSYGLLCAGQNYVTDDGNTRVYFTVDDINIGDNIDLRIYLQSGSVQVDWGDGSAVVSLTGTGNKTASHTFNTEGDYIIKIIPNSATYKLGYNGSNSHFITGGRQSYGVRKVEIGSGCTGILRQGFQSVKGVESISIPTNCTEYGSGSNGNVFNGCDNLYAVVLPPNSTLDGSANVSEYTRFLSFNTLATNQQQPFIGTASSLVMFVGTTTDGFIVPSSSGLKYFANIGTYTTQRGTTGRIGYRMSKTVIPPSVTTIQDYSFQNYYGVLWSLPTTPPSIPNATRTVNWFEKIYVPYSADHSVLNAYQTATNWSSFASKIEELPQ